jgi:hypothetical protein
VGQPWDADAGTDGEIGTRAGRHDDADDLVTGHDRVVNARQLVVDDVQVGAADRTRRHAHAHLAGTGHGQCTFGRNERTARLFEDHRQHWRTIPGVRRLLHFAAQAARHDPLIQRGREPAQPPGDASGRPDQQ